jgi:hypothetical protein
MALRQIRVAHYGFWDGFQVADLALRLPSLNRKYQLIADQANPELVVFSVLPGKVMPVIPDRGVPTLFMTGENVVPDMSRCDFAVSFQRDIDDPRHLRIPNWVQRFNALGIAPAALLSSQRARGATPASFCAYLHNHRVPMREEFVRELSRRAAVDCPGLSMNNMPAIGAHPDAKLDFLRGRRFCVAFENAVAPGYTTEKLPEALLAGSVPIYFGDPLVGLDFNPAAFLNLADHGSLAGLAAAVMAIESDPAAWQRMRDQPAYVDDTLPECAQDDRIFAFLERALDQVPQRTKAAAPPPAKSGIAERIDEDFRAHVRDTSPIGFHGDRHLVQAMGRALEQASLFIETGANEGASLAYAASLRPDIPMRSSEPYATALATARTRCAPYPKVRISDAPSPDALSEVLCEFPVNEAERPVFWLDAHFHGVPLPLGQEIALVTRTYPRAHMFIDDFQIPDRPWFGFDAYPDGTIGVDYLAKHLDRDREYVIVFPRYREKSSTHHPLRGWACVSWGLDLGLVDDDFYDVRKINWA